MSSYAKFLKDILAKKRTIETEIVTLSPKCSAIRKHELPPKMTNPGSFSIPCKLHNVTIDRELCDLGASVLSINKKLNVGELKSTTMALQLADRSVKYPLGILEDVSLKVDAIVHVRAGRLTLKIGGETVEFTLDKNLKQSMSVDSACYIDALDALADEFLEEFRDLDPLEVSLEAIRGGGYVNNEEVNEYLRALDSCAEDEVNIQSTSVPVEAFCRVDHVQNNERRLECWVSWDL
ncbi:PREDICTED: uncharacterized protein LOC104804731 [Tarenaya hassleriana]|uniref:uncharacterized protein LOC104804731 n=1 Tax=Tarenaya hassleriana TaxID=28532 RepID=UPI00053C668D|nr:PREDICTED: uncharacterized protein LOC104804731 [Tarenaya hassleriana]